MAVAVAVVAAGLVAGGWAGARACGWCKGQVFGFDKTYTTHINTYKNLFVFFRKIDLQGRDWGDLAGKIFPGGRCTVLFFQKKQDYVVGRK